VIMPPGVPTKATGEVREEAVVPIVTFGRNRSGLYSAREPFEPISFAVHDAASALLSSITVRGRDRRRVAPSPHHQSPRCISDRGG
jgi:hypothetical protein